MSATNDVGGFIAGALSDCLAGHPLKITGNSKVSLAGQLLVAAALAASSISAHAAGEQNIFRDASQMLGAISDLGFAKRDLERAGQQVRGGADPFESARQMRNVVQAADGVYRVIGRHLPDESAPAAAGQPQMGRVIDSRSEPDMN